jgi:preprotein translocase subunit YajC
VAARRIGVNDAMFHILIALGGQPQQGQPNPFGSLVMMGLIFAIFYFVLILPMRNKQRKLERLIKELKAGDKVVINPGIYGTIVGVDDETFLVRIDDKTRIRVLKSAVAGLQGDPEAASPAKA